MPEVIKSVLLPYSAASMFELVDAVESYADFLPWCGGAQVHSRDQHHTKATIHIRYLGVSQALTTYNKKFHPSDMTLELVDGPFHSLSGAWKFIGLADDACKVEFNLRYAFANPVVEGLIGPVMANIAETFVDRFAARAEALALAQPARILIAPPQTTL